MTNNFDMKNLGCNEICIIHRNRDLDFPFIRLINIVYVFSFSFMTILLQYLYKGLHIHVMRW